MLQQVSLDGCYVLSPEAQLTVSNLANADNNCYIDDILLWTLSEYDGYDYYLDNLYFYHLTNNKGFIPHMMYQSPEYGGPVQLCPGESVTFSISEYVTLYDEETGEAFLTYDLLVLGLNLYDPDAGQSWTAYYGFVY